MMESVDRAIEELEKKLEDTLRQASGIKKAINQLLILSDQPPRYPDTDAEIAAGRMTIAPDQFLRKGLATAVKEYLKMKGRAAPLREIYEVLKQGGFEFSGEEKFQPRGLAISLSKNTQTFVYLKSSDSYGLLEFYPEYTKKKEERRKKGGVEQEESETQEGENKEENK